MSLWSVAEVVAAIIGGGAIGGIAGYFTHLAWRSWRGFEELPKVAPEVSSSTSSSDDPNRYSKGLKRGRNLERGRLRVIVGSKVGRMDEDDPGKEVLQDLLERLQEEDTDEF